MKKFFVLFIFFPYTLFACALCTIYQPSVLVQITVHTDSHNITSMDVRWEMVQEFTKELAKSYDKNSNGTFEDEEIIEIQKAIIDYIKDQNFLTTIKYEEKNTTKPFKAIEKLNLDINSYKTLFANGQLVFHYSIENKLPLLDEYVLFVQVHDIGGYFKFLFEQDSIVFDNKSAFSFVPNTRQDLAFIHVTSSKNRQIIDTNDTSIPQESLQQTNIFLDYLANVLNDVSKKLQKSFEHIQQTNSLLSIIFLLGFSFLYGFLHAAGPGHGKTIVASYLFSSDKNIQKALLISLAIGVVHAFSAFILTLLIYFSLNVFLEPFVDDVAKISTKISAVVIIAIALFLLYKKLKSSKQSLRFTTHNPSCGCASCNVDTKTTDLGVILSAGIIPCPGTIVIFILSLSYGLYFIGLLSALFMSLGMSCVIFLTSLLSLGMKKSITHHKKLILFFEYSALFIILALGLLLLVT